MLTLQIATGIWLGGLFLVGTFWAAMTIREQIERNRRVRAPWYIGLFGLR